jgi:hypothetical protein
MNTEELNILAKEIHELSIEKGLWDKKRSRREVYADIHLSISKAVEESRTGRPEVYYGVNSGGPLGFGEYIYGYPLNNEKPQGELIELAGVVIRCLDWMLYDGRGVDYTPALYTHELPQELSNIEVYSIFHNFVCNDILLALIQTLDAFCKSKDWDIWEAVRITHEYNKTRLQRHAK